ncbi:MAG: helix-turn-helix transcriptional regulator [Treponema sp.]|jgi:DNA-binding CsgD family transcriptional regulator|nr:helix-turn-helix transcriptional regulator [Treponema sp.]
MDKLILAENERKRLNPGLPWLLCFALFTGWQVGVFSYTGAVLAVAGRLPLGIDTGNLMPLIAAGYTVSIVFMTVFPTRIVWAERILAGLALVSALALYLPLPSPALTLFFLIQLLCCCIMIGFETALIVALFSDRSAVKHLLVAYGIIFIAAALMQNQFFEMPYGVFKIFNAAALALQLLFYGKLPAGVWPEYVRKGTGLICPKRLFAGLFALCFLGNIVFSFGISVAEGVEHGVFVFYLSFAVFAIAGYALLPRFRLSPLRHASVSVVVSVTGFILAIMSLYVPLLALPACALLGPGTVACILIPYYGVVMTRRYPSRFISPAIIGISFVASVLVLGVLIEVFRDNSALLYTVYLAIAVAMAVLYLLLEPYLLYSSRGSPLIGEEGIAEIAGRGESETEGALARAGPPLTEAPPGAPPLPDPSLPEAPLTDRQRRLIASAFDRLSARELAVAEMMMQGFKYEDICGRLSIKKTTAYWYRNQLFDKLQIKSLRELFDLAEKHNRVV